MAKTFNFRHISDIPHQTNTCITIPLKWSDTYLYVLCLYYSFRLLYILYKLIRVIIKSGIEWCPHMIWIGLIFTFNTSFRDCHICLICLHVYNIWIMSWFSLHILKLLISFNFHRFKSVPHGSILCSSLKLNSIYLLSRIIRIFCL